MIVLEDEFASYMLYHCVFSSSLPSMPQSVEGFSIDEPFA